MSVKRKVKEFVAFQVVSTIARLFYFAGLTALIPLIPLVLSPSELVSYKFALGIAIGSIVLGFLCVYWFSGSRKIAYRALGFMTLVPGLLAVLFSYMGPRRMALFFQKFGEVSPLVESWIDSYVPKAWLLAGIYICVGVMLIWLSERR